MPNGNVKDTVNRRKVMGSDKFVNIYHMLVY